MPASSMNESRRARASRRFQLLLLVLAGGLIASGAFFSATTIGKLRQSIEWVGHTQTVKHAIEELFSASHDVDTYGLRYLLQLDSEQLRAHAVAIEIMEQRAEYLRSLLVDNPTQLERLRELRIVFEARSEWFRRAIGETQNLGNALASPLVIAGEGSDLSAQVRFVLQQIENAENHLLLERQRDLENVLTQGSVTVLLLNALALVMACVALFLLRRGERNAQLRREVEVRALEAERSAREKSEFLASMSHEIRTPMNAVLGFSQLLAQTRIEPQAQEYLRAIRTSGEALLALINDILDLSKIEAGKLSLNPQPVEIRELVDSTVGVFSEAAGSKGIALRTRVSPDVPRTLTTDPHRLRQVLMNLLSNAVKYTDHGEVELIVQAVRHERHQADLAFRVRDTGRGIAEDAQSALFEPFHRAVSDEDPQTGSGLGLAIVRRLTRLLGGKVSFKSALGRGSEFTVRLEQARVDEPLAGTTSGFGDELSFAQLTPSRILIVDDVAWNRDLLRAFLSEGEHEIVLARDGQEAVEQACEFKPDLILMDLRMPVLDGREATRRIRASLGEEAPTVIAISASSMSREERALGDLFDGYVRKPVARELLFAVLAEHLGTHAADGAGEDPDGSASGQAEPGPTPPAESAELDEASRSTLRTMRAETLPRLQRVMRAAEVKRFSTELVELAGAKGLPDLAYYGQRLNAAVQRFDVTMMESLLAQGDEHLASALGEVD